MKRIRSLAYRTDFFFLRWGGEVIDRGEYLIAKTPSNPGYFCGNLLFFGSAPCRGDFKRWTALFKKAFAKDLGVRHMTFGWDSPKGVKGACGEFISRGFKLDEAVVLTASRVKKPPRCDDRISVRPLTSDADWEAATANQIRCRVRSFARKPYRLFKSRQMSFYRRIAEAGKGAWFGAFLGERLVGDLGIFIERGVGRFQNVGTHPGFRRRGVCRTLVYGSARIAMKSMGARTLVMSAEDKGNRPARVYRAVGFRDTEKTVALIRSPRGVRV